jgi:hypothetical protein
MPVQPTSHTAVPSYLSQSLRVKKHPYLFVMPYYASLSMCPDSSCSSDTAFLNFWKPLVCQSSHACKIHTIIQHLKLSLSLILYEHNFQVWTRLWNLPCAIQLDALNIESISGYGGPRPEPRIRHVLHFQTLQSCLAVEIV